jgi:hypothetical protein
VAGATIRQVIAIDRGDHNVGQAKFRHGVGDAGGFVGGERAGLARGDVAKGAGTGAGVAHDHHGGVPLRPALADVGAGGLLADRDEAVGAHQRAGLVIDRMSGRLHPDPGRFALDGVVRPVRLLRMALRHGAVVDDEASGHARGDVAGEGKGVKQRLAARGLVALFSVSHQGRCGMDTVSTQHRWSEVLEDDIYQDVVRRCAPHLPLVRTAPARAAMTALEIEAVCDNWIWTVGHDSLIVQAASKALDRLFPNLDEQYFLARQIGDDGFHAEFVRNYVTHRLGRDPIRQINDIVRMHWEALGDLPYRNIHSFFAWELHYELHILSRVHTERRTRRINDPAIKQFAEERVGPDEAVHRLRILDWWMGYYAAHTPAERAAIASRVIALDDEIQRRLNPYLQLRYQRSAVNCGTDIRGKDTVYNNFRREVLARLLDMPPERIGRLTSLAE